MGGSNRSAADHVQAAKNVLVIKSVGRYRNQRGGAPVIKSVGVALLLVSAAAAQDLAGEYSANVREVGSALQRVA